jgi:hypothetical protein
MRTTVIPDSNGDQMLAFGTLLGRSGKVIESEISGTSMGSTLPSGCHIRIRPVSNEEYHAGQVVAIVAGASLFAHRIVFRSRQGVLTRGDGHTWCDLPVPVGVILGVVTAFLVDGEWHLLGDIVSLDSGMKKRNRMIETLLRVFLQIDIGLAQRAWRMLMLLARWHRRLVSKQVLAP